MHTNGKTTAPQRRDDLITILMATWLMIGLFVDGWAHTNLPGLETFFTPWHGIFYSGYLATAAWMAWVVIRNQRSGKGIPVGYGLGLLGVAIFGLGGIGDLTWHTIFGIEQELEALFSPTHLMLFAGLVLIFSTPLRAALVQDTEDTPSFGTLFPALLSITLTTAIVAFMNHGGWGFTLSTPFESLASLLPGGVTKSLGAFLLIGAANQIYMATFILMAPLFLLLRRWALPFGAISFLFTVISVLAAALREFHNPLMTIAVPVGSALVAEMLALALRPVPSRPGALRAFAFIVPLVTWGLFFLVGRLTQGLVWTPALWAGMAVAAALASLTLSVLMVPTAQARSATKPFPGTVG